MAIINTWVVAFIGTVFYYYSITAGDYPMYRHKIAAAFVAGLLATAVQATTYNGSLTGTINSGTAKYFDSSGWRGDFSLIGKKIDIEFSTSIKKNFFDSVNNVFYPRYVVNNVRVRIDIWAPLDDFGGLQTNDPSWTPYGDADFTGNAKKGVFDVNGSLSAGPTATQSVHFFFEDPDPTDGKLVGGGIASAYIYRVNPSANYSYDSSYYTNIKFTLDGGKVSQLPKLSLFSVAAVPEPATWGMMIAGFGFIGGAMRSRNRTVAARYR